MLPSWCPKAGLPPFLVPKIKRHSVKNPSAFLKGISYPSQGKKSFPGASPARLDVKGGHNLSHLKTCGPYSCRCLPYQGKSFPQFWNHSGSKDKGESWWQCYPIRFDRWGLRPISTSFCFWGHLREYDTSSSNVQRWSHSVFRIETLILWRRLSYSVQYL